MPLEFTTTTDTTEDLLRVSAQGLCPLCGVRASPAYPLLRLTDEGDVVFDGCPACLDGQLEGVPAARALLRVALVVARGTVPGPEAVTA